MKTIYWMINIMMWVYVAAGDPQVATMKKTYYEDSGTRNENTLITESGDNLIFKDPTTGQKTLAQLAAMNDGITTDSADLRYQRHYTRVFYVAAAGGNYTTIQAAVNAADAGTSVTPTLILVAPGVYPERITIDGKNVHLKGLGPRESVTIEYEDLQAVFGFGEATVNLNPGANRVIALENLTIWNPAEGDAGVAVCAGDNTASGGEYIYINNCHIKSGCRDALTVRRSTSLTRNSRIENAPGNAHTIWGVFDETVATFVNNVIYTSGANAMAQLQNAGTYRFFGNTYEDNSAIDTSTATVARQAEVISDSLAVNGTMTIGGAAEVGGLATLRAGFEAVLNPEYEESLGIRVAIPNTDDVKLEFGRHDSGNMVYDTNLYSPFASPNVLKTDDAFQAASYAVGTTAVIDASRVVTSTQTNTDNTRLDGNRLSATNTDGDLELAGNGTGDVNITTGDLELNGTERISAAGAGTFVGVTSSDDINVSESTNGGNGVMATNANTGSGAFARVRAVSDGAAGYWGAFSTTFTGISGWTDCVGLVAENSASNGMRLFAQSGFFFQVVAGTTVFFY